MARLSLSKSLTTNEITQDEASEWFRYLAIYTEKFLKEHHGWYMRKGYWPIKAQKENAIEKEPKFIVIHHTSNRKGNYKPALNRFFSAKKASSHFLIGKDYGQLLYLVPLHNLAYHAIRRSWLPISVRRALNIEKGWLDEPGLEVAGNGIHKLFTHEQLKNSICLLRFVAAYYPTIEELKSHRFFSRRSRSGDPGPHFLLPLVEHAVFNDVNIMEPSYWLESYRKDPIKFVNNAAWWFKEYNVDHRDEWADKRNRKVTKRNLF